MRWQAIVSEALPAAGGEKCFAELWDWFSRPDAWKVSPQAAGVLTQLAGRGLTVGIASNFNARLFGLVDAIPDLRLLREHCVISSAVGWRKPAREFYAAVAADAHQPVGAIACVGDDVQNDFEGAIAAGMRAILFDPAGTARHEQFIGQLRDLVPGSGVSQ